MRTKLSLLVVALLRDRKRKKTLAKLVAEAHEQYGGVFKRLAE